MWSNYTARNVLIKPCCRLPASTAKPLALFTKAWRHAKGQTAHPVYRMQRTVSPPIFGLIGADLGLRWMYCACSNGHGGGCMCVCPATGTPKNFASLAHISLWELATQGRARSARVAQHAPTYQTGLAGRHPGWCKESNETQGHRRHSPVGLNARPHAVQRSRTNR